MKKIFTLLFIFMIFPGCSQNSASAVKGNVKFIDDFGVVWLTSEDLSSVSVKHYGGEDYRIKLEFNSEGRKKFLEATKTISEKTTGKKVLHIHVNDEIISSPMVAEAIDSDYCEISSLTKNRANEIANQIKNPPKIKLTPTQTISPTPSASAGTSVNPDDYMYSGFATVKQYADSGKVEFTISKDQSKVTSMSFTLENVAFSIQTQKGTSNMSIKSLNTSTGSPIPIVDNKFSFSSDQFTISGEIKTNGDIEGKLRYVYKNNSTDNPYSFDLGEWEWTAKRSN